MQGATHFILDFKTVYDNARFMTEVNPIEDLCYFLHNGNTYKDIAIWYIKPKVKTP